MASRAALSLATALLAAAAPRGAPSNDGTGLTQTIYDNNALAAADGSAPMVSVVQSTNLSSSGAKPFSGTLIGMLQLPKPGVYQFLCDFSRTSIAYVWVDGHMVCHDGNSMNVEPGSDDNALPVDSESAGRWYPFRIHLYYNQSSSVDTDVSVGVRWNVSGQVSDIASEYLSPVLSAAETEREALQRDSDAVRGWGPWVHGNLLSMAQLPSGAAFDIALCSRSGDDCVDKITIDHSDPTKVGARVGYYAIDRSYAQYYFWANNGVANVSVEWSAGPSLNDIDVRVKTITCAKPCNYDIKLTSRFAWFRAGTASASATASTGTLRWTPAGLSERSLSVTGGSSVSATEDSLLIAMQGPGGTPIIATSSLSGASAAATRIAAAEQVELKRYTEYGELAEVKAACQAAVMWNWIYVPSENGPLLPVSRGWNFARGSVTPDFSYAIFDWDNYFATFLANIDNRVVAYSNLIQVTKSKVAAGFVPNYSGGSVKSQDRTEPPIGAKVLQAVFERWGDAWLVELLIDDLIDWNDWFYRRRILDGLVALGSFNEERIYANKPGKGDTENVLQGARFESGLDNSPMYDLPQSDFDNVTTHLMQLQDVGMSSMVAQEGFIIADLLDKVLPERRAEAQRLRARAQSLQMNISSRFWSEESQIWVNRFPNGTFYPRITPTSFYPMMAGVGTDAQVEAVVQRWLYNKSRFCIAPTGDSKGNGDECYWGLPSISADDPAFPKLGYWRGFVWGPMAQLTYWSLRSSNAPAAGPARKALASQLKNLMLFEWGKNRHICENYNPHKTADTSKGDCTGDQFYHWGALTGYLSLQEAGYV